MLSKILDPYTIWGITFILLLISSILDLKGKDIPIKIPVISAIAQICILALTRTPSDVFYNTVFASTVFAILFIGNIAWGLGGADTLAAASATIGIGQWGLVMVFIAFAMSIPFTIYRHRKHKGALPFIPFITLGYIIAILMSIFT